MITRFDNVNLRYWLLGLIALLVAVFFGIGQPDAPAYAQTGGTVPGNTQGTSADSDFWREIRQGGRGTVASQNQQGGQLIQSEGDTFRSFKNGPLFKWTAWGLFGTIALLALFFILRGRIMIEHGPSGETVTRFTSFERMSHWILAVSFIVLAITGLNMVFGKHLLLPILGAGAFASLTAAGKWLHNFLAFGFMLGVALIFVQWVWHNFPNRHDIKWLLQGGGLFVKGVHPPSKKFNAGQKVIFWSVILCGVSISLSGISLMFPFQTSFFADTFAILNTIGFNFPTELTAMQEMQYSTLWHSIVAVVFIAIILAHIYIGSVGMEGAFDAMGTGEVDKNWAKEHHSLWVKELDSGPAPAADTTKAPAE